MSLQKFGLISLSIVSLGINIILCAYILRRSKAKVETQGMPFFAAYIEDNARLGGRDIYDFLVDHHIYFKSADGFCILIPPYPCGACIDNLMDTILPIIRETAVDASIIVPHEHARDIRVQVSATSSIDILEYEILSDDVNIVYSIDSGILFYRSGVNVEDYFIASPWNSSASFTFIDKYSSIL